MRWVLAAVLHHTGAELALRVTAWLVGAEFPMALQETLPDVAVCLLEIKIKRHRRWRPPGGTTLNELWSCLNPADR